MTVELTAIPASDALASSSDLTTYGYSTDAATYLTRASTRVRGYARQLITYGTSTIELCHPYRLPERPVRSVTTVLDHDGSALTDGTDFELHGQFIVCGQSDPITVTYTHGFSIVPDAIREIVCAVADRMYRAPASLGNGVVSEQAGAESITWGSEAYSGVADLTGPEKRVIDRVLGLRMPRSADTL